MSHEHYFRDIPEGVKRIDVYRFLDLFGVTCPVAQHVVKKALAAGQRGHKDTRRDWKDIIDSAERKLEMLNEDQAPQAAEEWPEETRIEAIGRNGNDGQHYYIGGSATFEESADFEPFNQ